LKTKGITGSSILRKIPFFDLVVNCSLESMHCLWEGISAQFADLWFNSKNHEHYWYIGSPTILQQINNKWDEIQTPHNMRQLSFIENKSIWKGTKFFKVLFYSN
jgi:hypothetical protein